MLRRRAREETRQAGRDEGAHSTQVVPHPAKVTTSDTGSPIADLHSRRAGVRATWVAKQDHNYWPQPCNESPSVRCEQKYVETEITRGPMGCGCSCEGRVLEQIGVMANACLGGTGLGVHIMSAANVPHKLMASSTHYFVRVELLVHGTAKVVSLRTSARDGAPNPEWNETVRLGDLELADVCSTAVRFSLHNQEGLVAELVGEATLTLKELLEQTEHTLLIQNRRGDGVLRWGSPPVPCELHVAVAAETRPASWPVPLSLPPGVESCSRHIFMMSRGTRGDVQPFVALARGMASLLGWRITICTELNWKGFVLGKCADVGDGVVSFLPSGGDTELQTSGWLEQMAMSSKTEVQ